MKKNIMRFLNEFSKAILVPVFTLPIIGIILSCGILLTNKNIPISNVTFLYDFGKIIKDSLLSIFINLSPLFCVGIVAGMTKKKRGEASLNALILFLIFLYSMNSYMEIKGMIINGSLRGTGRTNMLGLQVLDMGVFLGMLIGIIAAKLHNKFVDVEFNGAMRLYGGPYLALFIGIPIIMVFAIISTHLWPIVQLGISGITKFIFSTGAFGVGVYGFLERILIPTGLHHLLWIPIEFSSLSGTQIVDGKMIEGVRNIAIAELSSPNVMKLSHGAIYLTKAMSKMFGLVGAALALYKCSNKENKSMVKAILIPAVIASVLPGITEPLEFSFLFTAPILFVAHSLLAGLGMAVVAFFNVKVVAVSGGLEFLALMLPSLGKTDVGKFLIIGIIQAFIYYYVFKFLILRLNLKTIGRENDSSEIKLYSKKDYENEKKVNEVFETSEDKNEDEIGKKIVIGLGGKENIIEVGNCFSRLRIKLKNKEFLNEEIISQTPSSGIVKTEDGVQIIYGLQVQKIRKLVDQELGIEAE